MIANLNFKIRRPVRWWFCGTATASAVPGRRYKLLPKEESILESFLTLALGDDDRNASKTVELPELFSPMMSNARIRHRLLQNFSCKLPPHIFRIQNPRSTSDPLDGLLSSSVSTVRSRISPRICSSRAASAPLSALAGHIRTSSSFLARRVYYRHPPLHAVAIFISAWSAVL